MSVAAVRLCQACGAQETGQRRLITVGELIGVRPDPGAFAAGLEQASDQALLWSYAYCRSRDCVGAAARTYLRRRLNSFKTHGRGVRRRPSTPAAMVTGVTNSDRTSTPDPLAEQVSAVQAQRDRAFDFVERMHR